MTTIADQLPLAHGAPLDNRFALAPLTNKQSHPDGTLSDDEIRWLVARAEGGFGLTMTAAAYVAPAGKAWTGQLGIHDDAMLPGLERLATELRAAGSRSAVQLHHGGLRADPAASGTGRVAPWAVEGTARALSTGEVEQAVADFVAAAVRAERAGFDGVEVHGAHGYLVGEFLDHRHNQRTDGWGGELAARARFVTEVVREIRAATGPDFQLGLRLTPERQGILLAEAKTVAADLMTSGWLDYLDMSLWDAFKTPYEEEHDGLLIEHFTELPRGETRLGVAGKVLSAADAQWCLDHGADFALIGSGAILHHDFPRRALADPAFVACAQPVTRDHLAAERVGPAFVDYLSTGWSDWVA
ncbi:NADH:flavin oxidoreductase [Nocardioides sp. SYSU D00038]|uniref:NADH:flavin oxidoreductase n=1 Tax=Nocardioides sp. SYSU D00038 TaxID=2812554 RepID=UPI001967B5B1|nr:NADH:flavin oxidoreductase [Nocardioides sp. SYSU D00038]